MVTALALPEDFYADFRAQYTARRAVLLASLSAVGLPVFEPQGTYFVLSHIGHLGFDDDRAFAQYLAQDVGVACIPVSPFYPTNRPADKHLARFAFCKELNTLKEAGQRLLKLLD